MKREQGNWIDYRKRFGLSEADEIDLHFGRRDRNVASYNEAMADVEQLIRHSLHKAQENGRPYLMFVHGHSTSRPGQTTARSVVRQFMRSKEATPFVVKTHCIQHPTVFIAKIRNGSQS
jgi:dTDP-4-amino-4,6-dideoxygalactose transaminase